MKHLIIGVGVVGRSTGLLLEANNEEVHYHDKDKTVMEKLKKEGRKLHNNDSYDIVWICTAEWHVEDVLKELTIHDNTVYVIRSTVPIGTTAMVRKKYKINHLAHVPEFLKEKTAIYDAFNPDRIIVGTLDVSAKLILKDILKIPKVPIIFTTPTISETIKYMSNAWLATQISFWNEMFCLCKKLNINPQKVANAVTLDKRISKYGSIFLGAPFRGFCLPKDLDNLIETFDKFNLEPTLLKAVKKVNT